MSIILEALRKADKSREPGAGAQGFDQLPGAEPGTADAGRRPAVPVLVVATVFFLLVSIILITYLVVQKNRVPAPQTQQAAVPSAPRPSVHPAPPAPVMPPQVASRPVPPPHSGAAGPLSGEMPGTTTTTTGSVTVQPPAPAETVVSAKTSAPAVPPPAAPKSGAVVTAERPLTLEPTDIPDRPAQATARPEPVEKTSQTDAGSPELMDVPLLIEKPIDFQTSMPAVSVDVHVYSDTPARRFVMLNMKKYRERDKIQEGLFVHTITPDGVILQYHNELVKLPAQ